MLYKKDSLKKMKFSVIMLMVVLLVFLLALFTAHADEEELTDEQDVNGLAISETGEWIYYSDGEPDLSYTGFVRGVIEEEDAWWYVEKGRVTFARNDILWGKASSDPEREPKETWWYIKDSKVTDADIVAKNINGWWAILGGEVDYHYNGFLPNEYGWWYLENGRVTFKNHGIIHGVAALASEEEGEDGWWYVKDSKVINEETVANNSYGWWYIHDGKVDFDYTGVKQNAYGWWAIRDGKVDFNYNGFLPNEHGWWYLENGKVTFKKNDILHGIADTDPEAEGEDAWWYVKESMVTDTETVAKNNYGWWYINHGKVDFEYTGIKKNEYGWWRIVKGQVDFKCNSVEENEWGWWYIRNGKVDFGYTGLAENAYGWWYIKNGGVDYTYQGLAAYGPDYFYMVDGELDWSYNGPATLPGYNRSFTVKNGRLSGGTVPPSEAVSKKAQAVLNQIGWNLRAAFDWSAHMPYTYYTESGDPGTAYYANYGFDHHTGNCYVMAATFAAMAREMGYEVYQISGHIPLADGGLANHSWTELRIGDTFYVFDPNFENERFGGANGYQIYYGMRGTWRYVQYYRMHN